MWLLRRARGGCRTGGELRGGPASGGVAVLLQRHGGRGGVLVSRVAEVRRWCRDDGGAAEKMIASGTAGLFVVAVASPAMV